MEDNKEDTIKKILNMIENGMTQKDSAVLGGISEPTWHRWKKEDENRGTPESIESRVEASLLKYKQSLIQVVNVGSLKDPKLALEMLARRFPDEYGAKSKVEVIDPQAEIRRMMGIINGSEPKPEFDEDGYETTDEQVPADGSNLLPEQGRGADDADSGTE